MAKGDRFYFSSVTILLSEQCLGTGFYSSVYRARCDDLICAAKVLQPSMFDQDAQSEKNKQLVERFQRECDVLSALRHPNIVQHMGTWIDPDTNLPALLMELMDHSLTQFLEKAKTSLSFHTQVSICHDIALALSFLHSNNIIHRDLSSNKVLLTACGKAKVTDFCMAKVTGKTDNFNNECSNTHVYLPPEAIGSNPKFSDKTDSFSFGVLCLQIVTKQYPAPGPSQVLRAKKRVVQPEAVKREEHISLVPPEYPLLDVILDCIKDADTRRPSASEICHRVFHLREGSRRKAGAPGETNAAKEARLQAELVEMKELQEELSQLCEEINEHL